MANLVTDAELAKWAGTTEAAIAADPFAQDVLSKASDLVRDIAGQPTWEIGTIPFRARLIVLKLARRTYVNPDQEVSSTTGPISSRVVDEAAMALELTEKDEEYLRGLAPDEEGRDDLWTLSPGRGEVEMKTAFIPDNDQPNLVGPPWAIPYGDMASTDAFVEPDDVWID